MIRSRLGLKVLGLCALALGLMAFVASAAQAELTAHWNVAGSPVTGANSFQLEIREIENSTATLLFTTKGGTKVGILCQKAKFDEGGKLIKEGTLSLGRVLFEKCVVFLNEKLSSACEAHTTGQAVGNVLTEKATGLIVLDVVGGQTEDYVKITPDSGTLLAPIEMGPECAIGTLVKVEGILWIKDCPTGNKTSTERFLTEDVSHLIEESLHGMTALGQPATIDGSAFVQLPGGTTNFSGTPG